MSCEPPGMLDLEQIVEGAKDISSSAALLPKLMEILDDPESEMDDAVNLIRMDLALSAKVLRYANSSAFGVAFRVETIQLAVQRFGFRYVQKLVIVAAAQGVMKRKMLIYDEGGCDHFEASLACADLMCELFQSGRQVNQDVAYTIGLFHGIGKVILDTYLSEHHIDFSEPIDEEATFLEERKRFGFDHAELGAALLTHWQFPERIVYPIKRQFSVVAVGTAYREETLALGFSVFAGKQLPDETREPTQILESFIAKYPDIWRAMDMDREEISEAVERARTAFKNSMEIIGGA